MISFEWDTAKAASNLEKHKVSFEFAATVFRDPSRVVKFDREKDGELRWHVIGRVAGNLLLLVAFTLRDDGKSRTIRIISARAANRRERQLYGEG